MAKNHDPNFVAETKIYDPRVYKSLKREKKREVTNTKVRDG